MRRLELILISLAVAAACASPGSAPTPARAVYPGFDTWRYPGDAELAAWRVRSPYRWVGYYLPAPCHRDPSWSGRRETLERQGWGIAVLYVGQQTFDRAPAGEPTAAGPIICSRTLLTAEQGRAEARDATSRAAAEGFAPGSIVFLDVERMDSVPASMTAYYEAWVREMLALGRFLPGTYAHQRNATELHGLARQVYRAAGRTESPPFWVAGGADFSLDRPPWSIGLPFASIWQGAIDVEREWGGVRLRIDENVAARPSPSAPPPT